MGQSASSSVGGQTSGPTLTAHNVFCHQAPIGPERFDLPPTPFAGANIGAMDETLQAMELRWVAAMQPSSRGTARLSSEMSASLPAWMTPSQTPRLHWSDRQQQHQEQHQQHMRQQPAPQLPLDRSASDDIIDVLEARDSHPQQTQWRHIWELASASYLDRQHRFLWWRLLHSSLMCGRVSVCGLSCQLVGSRHSI